MNATRISKKSLSRIPKSNSYQIKNRKLNVSEAPGKIHYVIEWNPEAGVTRHHYVYPRTPDYEARAKIRLKKLGPTAKLLTLVEAE